MPHATGASRHMTWGRDARDVRVMSALRPMSQRGCHMSAHATTCMWPHETVVSAMSPPRTRGRVSSNVVPHTETFHPPLLLRTRSGTISLEPPNGTTFWNHLWTHLPYGRAWAPDLEPIAVVHLHLHDYISARYIYTCPSPPFRPLVCVGDPFRLPFDACISSFPAVRSHTGRDFLANTTFKRGEAEVAVVIAPRLQVPVHHRGQPG